MELKLAKNRERMHQDTGKRIIYVTKESGIPLIGALPFGIIDRGTSTLQVRCTSICNMNCSFCSTDGGPFSANHLTNYIVDINYLVEELGKVAKLKGDNLTIFLDSVGDPLTHPDFVKLVEKIKGIPEVNEIITITNGTLLTKEKIDALENAGLTQINISIHSLDEKQSKELFGSENYNLKNILEVIKYASRKIRIMLTPVLLMGVNEDGIEKIIEFAKENNCLVGLQNYETYKYSRKMKNVKKLNYWKFYRKIEELEKKHNVSLKLYRNDFVEKRERIPKIFKKGEKIRATVVAPGWIKGQKLAIYKDNCVSINNCNSSAGDLVNARIVENKNNIYLADLS